MIAGNGFFKPNISTIVGSLYPPGSAKRDGGFTIFYMGINLGAAMSPLLCGYIGETYGWHYGFGLATIGMLTGVVVFVAPTRVAQVLIAIGAAVGACGLFFFRPDNPFSITMNLLVAIALLVAAAIAWTALGRGGLPHGAGAPRDRQRLRKPLIGRSQPSGPSTSARQRSLRRSCCWSRVSPADVRQPSRDLGSRFVAR